MEQIIFLVLIAVVGLLRWISQIAEEKRNREAEKRTGPPPPNAPVQRAPAETEEERIRRFMEALGVPTANAPIPRAEQKREAPKPPAPAAPKRKAAPIDPFPRGGFPIPPVVAKPAPPPPLPQPPPVPAPPPLFPAPPSPVPTAAPSLPTRETTVFAPAVPVEFEVRDVTEAIDELAPLRGDKAGPQKRATTPELTLAARLRTAGGLRDAIVLREIFGAPRSMQPLDLTPIR